MSSQPPVWVITASTSGFGKAIALEALNRGHKVIATARNASKLNDVKAAGATVLNLDVTAPLDDLKKIAAEAVSKYGYVTHLINAAGYILDGAVEETSPEETQATFATNVFGTLNVSRAFLPYLRNTPGTKIIANFGSIASWAGGPAYALYSGTKWAVSGISEAMRPELEPFGIKTTVIEPGYFRTGFLNAGARVSSQVRIKEYDDTVVGQVRAGLDQTDNNQIGDVNKAAKVIVDVLTSSGVAQGRDIPLRLPVGSDADGFIREKLRSTEVLLDEWKDITTTTDHDDVKK